MTRPKAIRSEQLLDALIAAGILHEDDRATRVVIDLQVGHMPVLYIQRLGDERLLNLVQTLEGVEITREVAS